MQDLAYATGRAMRLSGPILTPYLYNVVYGPIGHAGLQVTPFQNRKKRDALLNHE